MMHRLALRTFSALTQCSKTSLRNATRTSLHTSSRCLSDADQAKTGQMTTFSRFPVPDKSTLPQDLKERVEEIEEKSGFMPNVFGALSYRPDELRAFMNYYDIVMDDRGSLTKADKEMIVVATSSDNNCLYCIIAHGALQRIYSRNPYLADQVAANWRTADIDDRQRAILEFAMELCHCRPLTPELFENLHKHGLTNDDAWDIGSVVALFALSNRMAFLTNMKPNHEFYLMGRIKREKKNK